MQNKAYYIRKLNIVLLFHTRRGTGNTQNEARSKNGVGITFRAFWPLRYFCDEPQCRSHNHFKNQQYIKNIKIYECIYKLKNIKTKVFSPPLLCVHAWSSFLTPLRLICTLVFLA